MTQVDARAAWDAAHAAYTAARTYSDNLPDRHPDEDAAVNRYCEAMDALLATDAPDLEALALKIDFMREREIFADDWLEIFAADARRLHSEGL